MHRNVAAVVEAGRRAGLDVRPTEYPDGARSAADAARAIGVDRGQIVKSLVFAVDGEPVLALVPGDARLDEARLAAAAGGGHAGRADADAVRAATGFPIGGVPPIGLATRVRVFVDGGLLRWTEVWAAAGHPHWCFPTSPQDLVRATGGVVADLADPAAD